MEEYITGTGQKLKVHGKENCKGRNCVIHNPSDHCMKDFPTNWRDDRNIMERICKCGVGHPDPDDLAFKESLGLDTTIDRIHGCCGCCSKDSIVHEK